MLLIFRGLAELVSLSFSETQYLRKQFAVNKTFVAVKHAFSNFLRSLSFDSIKCRWYWPDPQMIYVISRKNNTVV